MTEDLAKNGMVGKAQAWIKPGGALLQFFLNFPIAIILNLPVFNSETPKAIEFT